MDPLNKQERTEAFIKMLVLFLLTAVLMAIPMYYAFRLPCMVSKKNDDILKKVEEMRDVEKQFQLKTDLSKEIYSNYEEESNKVERDKTRLQYSAISLDMGKITSTISDDTIKSSLYSNVIFSFDKLFTQQEKIYNLRDSIRAIINPSQEQKPPVPDPIPETLETRFKNIIKEALKKNDNNRRLSGQSVGLSEKTFSSIVKELKIPNQ
jgi:hypothetical protein